MTFASLVVLVVGCSILAGILAMIIMEEDDDDYI